MAGFFINKVFPLLLCCCVVLLSGCETVTKIEFPDDPHYPLGQVFEKTYPRTGEKELYTGYGYLSDKTSDPYVKMDYLEKSADVWIREGYFLKGLSTLVKAARVPYVRSEAFSQKMHEECIRINLRVIDTVEEFAFFTKKEKSFFAAAAHARIAGRCFVSGRDDELKFEYIKKAIKARSGFDFTGYESRELVPAFWFKRADECFEKRLEVALFDLYLASLKENLYPIGGLGLMLQRASQCGLTKEFDEISNVQEKLKRAGEESHQKWMLGVSECKYGVKRPEVAAVIEGHLRSANKFRHLGMPEFAKVREIQAKRCEIPPVPSRIHAVYPSKVPLTARPAVWEE